MEKIIEELNGHLNERKPIQEFPNIIPVESLDTIQKGDNIVILNNTIDSFWLICDISKIDFDKVTENIICKSNLGYAPRYSLSKSGIEMQTVMTSSQRLSKKDLTYNDMPGIYKIQ